ncbi:PP2C family protein-serine/threonine phosphatase [Agromyces mangrovi Wang et al. 2018]|uniref:PP2C family protein-serine/threonine phosphatase n=1 Tax=Agromyces mangrovi TaxID=1858653 RepID=UPI003305D73B|nr:hypothetical protein GCM10025877_16020 [Agromyces mangrovi]
MLCSDGLSGVVSFEDIRKALLSEAGAKPVADRLVKASLDGGAPDNVTVVVLDIGEPAAPSTPPQIVGSAAAPPAFGTPEPARQRSLLLTPFRVHPVQETHFEPDSAEYYDEIIEEDARRRRRRIVTWTVGVLLIVAAVAGLAVLAYQWTQTRYFVGESNGRVAIYQGIQQNVGPIVLSELYREADIDVAELRLYDQQRVEETISTGSLQDAEAVVDRLEESLE